MRTITATEASRRFSDLLDAIERGDSVTVTRGNNLTDAARRVLADRDHFSLSAEAAAEWERINRRPAEELSGLRRLMQRPSPFAG
jgi:antitoxin (DNA-binding transcriptional repressor) of toxin-antitoxin stability system